MFGNGIKRTMKVAVYYRNDDVRLEERPIPEIGPGELLVEVEACGLCGGETMEWYLAPRAPKVLGHEPAGRVVQIGEGVKKFKVGDRVFAHHHVPCMSCHFCQRGYYTMCEHYGKTAIYPGGFAEFLRVPAENVQFDTLSLPDNVSFEEATLIEPMACTLKGIRQTPIHYGDTVAIVGMGLMGMSYLQFIRLSPAGKIFALDFSEWRLSKSLSLGATHTINPKNENAVEKMRDLNDGRLADVVIVTAPLVPAWEQGLTLCEKGANLHLGAPPAPEVKWSVHPNYLYFNEIKINSAYSATHIDTQAVLDMIASGRMDVKPLITNHFGLDGVHNAIQLLLVANESLKSIIVPRLTQA
jgi:L-iditol 2-dehydrogenase